MDSKPTEQRRGRGRPKESVKLLANYPWRYLYALTQTAIDWADRVDGPSEQSICLAFIAFKVGRPVKVGEAINGAGRNSVAEDFKERWQLGLPSYVVDKRWDEMPLHNREYFRSHQPGAAWRDKDIFRPAADNMRRTLRLWRTASATNPNRRWLAGMVRAMRICFCGLNERAEEAAYFAAEIGETRYFDAILRPVLARYAELRRSGVENPDLPPLSQLLDLIDPGRILAPNILPNDRAVTLRA